MFAGAWSFFDWPGLQEFSQGVHSSIGCRVTL
jgi:hypothetical protein